MLGHHVGHPPPVDPQRVGAASVIEQNLGGAEDVYILLLVVVESHHVRIESRSDIDNWQFFAGLNHPFSLIDA